jgi:type I restriction enzyme S subunit
MSWEKLKIQDFAEVVTGGTPSTTVKEYWSNGTIPWLNSGALNEDTVIKSENYITKLGLENSAARIMPKDTVLIALTGTTTGVVGYLTIEACANQSVTGILPSKKHYPKYLYYYLKSVRKKILHDSYGGAQKHISQGYVKNIEVTLPSLPTQKRIAEILDAADALKRKDQELLKKYDDLAQAIFIDMFGDPVRNEKRWEMKRLKEISTKIHSGNTPKGGSNVYVKKGITFFRSQNVWKNNLVYDDIAFIDEKTHLSMMKSSLKHKDILMTKTGRINTENSSLGRAALFLGEDDSANVNGHVYLIRLQKKQVHEFVVHILTTKEYRGLIRDVCVGGIDKRQLNKDHIEDFPIIYPPIIEQQKFAKYIKDIQIQKQKAEESAKKSEFIFNSLIQKAFKGEIV